MSTVPFKVAADWDDDGLFTGTGEDVTERLHGAFFATRGKDDKRQFSPPAAGSFGGLLFNISRDYTPGNTSSPIYPNVAPGKKLRWSKVAIGGGGAFLFEDGSPFLFEDGTPFLLEDSLEKNIWTGILDDIPQHPERENLTVGIPALGMLSRLRGKIISTALYQNILVSDAIGHLLDAAGWPALERSIQVSTTIVDWFWLDNEDAFDALVELVRTDGPQASAYENGDGWVVFENNAARTTQTRSTISQATYSHNDVLVQGLTYNPNFKDVIRAATLTINERAAQAKQEIWNFGSDLVLTANQTKKLLIRSSGSDPFMNAVIPSAIGSDTVFTFTADKVLTGGQHKIEFDGERTSFLAYNATASDWQTALEALSNINVGDIIVSGGPIATAPILIQLTGQYAGRDITTLFTIVESTLNPIAVPATIEATEVFPGSPPLGERQMLQASTILTVGSFVINLHTGAITPSLAYNATASDIQTAIRTQSGFSSTTTTGGPISTTPVQVTFADYPTNIDEMTTTGTGLSGSVPDATIGAVKTSAGGVPDYVRKAGAIASMTFNRTSGPYVELTIVATSAGLTLSGLRVRAQPVTITRTHQVTYPTTTTVPDGQIYRPSIRTEISLSAAETYLATLVAYYTNPRPTAVVTLRQNINDAGVDAVLAREVSDRITLVNVQAGLSNDFLIEQIKHSIEGLDLVSEFGCELVM